MSNPALFLKKGFLMLKSIFSTIKEYPPVKNINGVVFNLNFEDCSPLKKMIYYDMYEMGVIEALKTFLRDGDTFIDVGANIGYFTAVAAGCVGKNGQIHSFEPVPEYFKRLESFARINNQYKITVNQFAIGDEEKREKIYIGGPSRIGNNTFFPESLEEIKAVSSAEVSICRLDKYIKEKNIKNIKLIKIDVESFEFPALRGLSGYFSECRNKNSYPLIICEICPSICVRRGYKLQDLFDYMKSFYFYPFEDVNTNKKIDINKMIKEGQEVDVFFKNIKI